MSLCACGKSRMVSTSALQDLCRGGFLWIVGGASLAYLKLYESVRV